MRSVRRAVKIACTLTDAGLLVLGLDVSFWTLVTLELRINALLTVTDRRVRSASANGYNTRYQHDNDDDDDDDDDDGDI